MKKSYLLIVLLTLIVGVSNAKVEQFLGVDQRVDYQILEKLGPWDDRNYQVTKEDLEILPDKDQYLANVPVFYKILARKENPEIGQYYPRVLYQTFLINYGGLVKDGIWYKEGLGKYYHADQKYGARPEGETELRAINDNEVVMNLGGAEMTIEMKPSNNMIGVAGVNGNGQSMYFTTDGGLSWTKSQDNPNSCCDPTIDWSSDSSRVYQADLANCGFNACNIRVSYSDDDGQNWASMIVVDPATDNDKEFIHVDRSTSSPYTDNVYLTWHANNVMNFSRSTDMGVNWSTPMNFNSEPQGIGSDITTDTQGNIYYIYPSLSGSIRLLKSADGGASFANGVNIASLNGVFDMPIPAMETREAFIYVSTDTDKETGTVYAAWTDETDDSAGGGNGSASQNHAWIRVSKSEDQGATWQSCTIPHETSDALTVDRFHPWLKVGENGVVHIGYYDTRNSNNRSGVDFFYASSVDGCDTWSPEVRASTVTSTNISDGFEWGDYNGMSVVLDKIAMGFTDNRPGQGVAAMVVSGTNPKASTDFSLTSNPSSLSVCQGMSYMSTITVDSTPGYAEDVTLSFTNVPNFVDNELLNPTLVPAPGNSGLSFDVITGGMIGIDILRIQGVGNAIIDPGADFIFLSGFESGETGVPTVIKSIDIPLNYSLIPPPATMLTSPTDAATGISPTAVSYAWVEIAQATGYTLEIATDMAFSNIIETANVVTNSHTSAMTLPSGTTVYWRVTSNNACGAGMVSTVFSLSTSNEICFTTPTPIPDSNSAGIDITLPVADTGTIVSLTASFESDHTWPGDLILDLSHLGTTITLMDRAGGGGSGCSQDGVDVIFDDNSGTPVDGVCNGSSPGISGTVSPDEMLSGFNGNELAGDWVLNVSDNAGADTGDVIEFCILPVIQ